MFPIDWKVENKSCRYKMQLDLEKIPENNNTTKICTISEALASLESFTSICILVQQGKKTITTLFGAKANAKKARKITLADKSTIQMKATFIYDTIEFKNKTIQAWN